MARLKKVFFDTSVLVAGMVDFGERSKASLAAVDGVVAGEIEDPITAWHCCLEFYSVVTRLPEEYRLERDVALRFVQEEILDRFSVAQLPGNGFSGFFTEAGREGVEGGRIYDAHIGEIARRGGAELVVTDNRRHFTHLLRHGVRVLAPSELVAELEEPTVRDDRNGPESE